MIDTAVNAQQKFEIIEAYNTYAQGIDSKDWGLVRYCFADEVSIDYGDISAATGSPDTPRTAENWIGVLQSVINGFDGTRHTITNHRFSRDGDCIVCRAYLTAEHVIFSQPDIPVAAADEIATVIGEYTNTYRPTAEGWKICRSQLDIDWSAGNAELFIVAMGRAASA